MSASLSSHVLNTVTGRPAQNMKLVLEHSDGKGGFAKLFEGATNADGRVPGTDFPKLRVGEEYRLSFDTKAYFLQEGVKEFFYPVARIEFIVISAGHYHVPLLVSPFSFSTYRGS
jgi:5-hydroxyisourate hydrolase